MDLFGRSKKLTKANRPSAAASVSSSNSELNERAIPYDRLTTGRSPVQVGTISQGLRATGAISAPITNPTLTIEGTDLNIHSGRRRREEREQSLADLGTQSSDDAGRIMSPGRRQRQVQNGAISDSGSTGSYLSGGRRRGDSDTSGPSTSRSNMVDFGAYVASTASGSRTSNLPGSSRSTATSDQTLGSDSLQGHTRYPASLLSNGSETVGSVASQLRDHFPHQVRESLSHIRSSIYSTGSITSPTTGDFVLDRPSNSDELDAMFERIMAERRNTDSRDKGESTNMSQDQKWGIVYAHELDRFNKIKKEKGKGGKKDGGVYEKDTPEWYLKKFMDQTITAKHVTGLTVSLRTLPIRQVTLLCTNWH